MPTNEEIQIAAKLVFRGLVEHGAMRDCLGELAGEAEAGGGLAAVLVRRGLATSEVIERVRLEMNVEQGSIPDLIPGYRIVRKIGEGGMSWVFQAIRVSTSERVALKFLRPEAAENPRTKAQFLGEAKLLKSLNHENIVRAFEVGRIRGFYFFSMEYVDGESLLARIDAGGTLAEKDALLVVLQIARALEHLRERGIVHRDVKPGNILLTRDSTVKLCDLGLALRAGRPTGAEGETTVGTVAYLSPEQARGREDLDVRSDIYSLGVTLYHLVVGHLPFEGSDDREILARQIMDSLSAPEVKRRVSPHMHYFIEKMMAKDRDHRYQDPLDLMRDIEAQVHGRDTLNFEEGEAGAEAPSSRGARARRAEIRDRLRVKRIKRKRQK